MTSVSVVGAGTAGSLTVAQLSRFTDADISWYFDPEQPPVSVGEAATLSMPQFLDRVADYTHDDLSKINGTHKTGIKKVGWGDTDFTHNFPPYNVSMHFTADAMQQYLCEKVGGRENVTMVPERVSHDDLDTDYVVDCTGLPAETTPEMNTDMFIPVNSSYVVRIPWEEAEYSKSFHFARKYGWVFGVPTETHLSLGYQFNRRFNNADEVSRDLEAVVEYLDIDADVSGGLTLEYEPYFRTPTFSDNTFYNGNAGCFLEPLEATSLSTSLNVISHIWNIVDGNRSAEAAQALFEREVRATEGVVMMHYLAGSRWESPFWDYAQERGRECMERLSVEDPEWNNYINGVGGDGDLGSWPKKSFDLNIDKLGIRDELQKISRSNRRYVVT